MTAEDERARGLERHIQTTLLLLVVSLLGIGVGLLSWNFNTVQQMSVTVGRMEERMIAQADTIILLTKLSDDRYRAKDAEKDFAIRDRAILALDRRVREIEARGFQE